MIQEPKDDPEFLPCGTGLIDDDKETDSDEDENTLAKSLIDDIIKETEADDDSRTISGYQEEKALAE